MSSTRRRLESSDLRDRFSQSQMQVQANGERDGKRMCAVFHERALRLAQRGRQDTGHAAKTPVLVFRLGPERFGVELRHVKQVFARVCITPVPNARDCIAGLANLNGALRSVVDLGALVNWQSEQQAAAYIVLVRGQDKLFGLRVEAIEGVRFINLASLVAVEGHTCMRSAACLRGRTEDHIAVIDMERLIDGLRRNEQSN